MTEQRAKPRGRPFPKGTSGNPGGRPKAVQEVVELAQSHSPDAIRTLVKIASDKNVDPRARVAAANSILDRGLGKPPQAVKFEGQQTVVVKRVELMDVTAASPN